MSSFPGAARPEEAAYEADAEMELFLLATSDMVGEDTVHGDAADGGVTGRSRRAVAVTLARLGGRGLKSAGLSTPVVSSPRCWCAGDSFALATLPVTPGRASL